MRSLVLSFSDTGGGGRAAINIFKSLKISEINSSLYVKKKKTDLVFVQNFFKANSSLLDKYKEKINRNVCKLESKNIFSYQSPSIFPTFVSKKINNLEFDIFHLCWINEFLSIEDIGKLDKPIVWSICDMWPFTGINHYDNYNETATWRKSHFSSLKKFSIDKWVMNRKIKAWKKPMNIVVPNKWMYDCVKDSKIMSNFDCHIIKWPIDEKIFFQKNKKDCKNRLNLNKSRRLLIFGASNGLNDKRKGWKYLEKAMQLTKSEFDLLIFGIKKPSNFNLKIKGNIYFKDKINDDRELCDLYNSADCLILPSLNDNTPLVSQEAQMCGLPIVLFDHNGLSDVIKHKFNGYKAKPKDSLSLAEGIDWVLENLNDDKLINNSLLDSENIKLKFIGNEYKKLYEKILNR